MKNNLVINDANFTRTKKKLKKSLEKEGISLPLSKIGEILADSLGFQNTFDIQKNLLNIEESTSLSKKYLDDIIYILEEFLKYITYDMVKINQKLKHIHYTQFYHPEYFNEILRCISIKTIYLKQYYEPILLGTFANISEETEFTIKRAYFSSLRYFARHLYECTGRRAYNDFYTVMDDYHNIEIYYLLNTEERETFWIKPVIPTEKSNYWLPNYDISSKIKFNLEYVMNEITDDNLNSLAQIPLDKNIIIIGKTGVGKTTAIDFLVKNNEKHNRLVKLEEPTEFMVFDDMDYKQKKDILKNKFKQKTILSLYAENYHNFLQMLVDENFDFNKVGIIIEIKRLANGSILYSVPYNEDINKENLNNWLKYIKNKK